jgi:hypothetical protein
LPSFQNVPLNTIEECGKRSKRQLEYLSTLNDEGKHEGARQTIVQEEGVAV